jgi:hypothetical protein
MVSRWYFSLIPPPYIKGSDEAPARPHHIGGSALFVIETILPGRTWNYFKSEVTPGLSFYVGV